jgi:hypothetical protein
MPVRLNNRCTIELHCRDGPQDEASLSSAPASIWAGLRDWIADMKRGLLRVPPMAAIRAAAGSADGQSVILPPRLAPALCLLALAGCQDAPNRQVIHVCEPGNF